MDLQKIEDIISESIAKIQEDGWTIAPSLWFNATKKKCCPFGAVILSSSPKGPLRDILKQSVISNLFEIEVDSVTCFTQGFDNSNLTAFEISFPEKKSMWELGQKFRSKFL